MVGWLDTCRIECVIRWRWVVDVWHDSFLIVDCAKKRHSGSAGRWGRTLLCTSQAAYVTLHCCICYISSTISQAEATALWFIICPVHACMYICMACTPEIKPYPAGTQQPATCWQRWQVRTATRQRIRDMNGCSGRPYVLAHEYVRWQFLFSNG